MSTNPTPSSRASSTALSCEHTDPCRRIQGAADHEASLAKVTKLTLVIPLTSGLERPSYVLTPAGRVAVRHDWGARADEQVLMWMGTMTDNYPKLSRYNTYEAQATVSNVKIAGVDQQAPWLDLRASLSRNGSYPLRQCVLVLA